MIDLKHLTCSSSKLLKEANEALRKHEYQTAQRLYTEALRSGENHLLLCNRAAAYMGLNMYQEALDDSNRAIALNREWIKAYNTKALAEAKLGRPAEAFSTLTESIRLAPTNQSLLMSLRSLVLSIIPLVQEGLSEPSLHPDVLPFACYICQQVFHDPVTVLCGHSFCRACLQTCLKQDACPQCHRTLTSSIDTLKTNITLTHIIEKAFPIHASCNEKIKRVTELQQQGQFEAAVQLLEQISNTLPQYQPALIQLSNIFLDLRRYAEAETAAVRAQRVLPNNGRGQLARAAVAVATGKLSTALTLSLESYRCCPVSRRAQEFMVRCVTERILVEPQLTLGDITSCDVCYRETVLLTQQPKDSNEMMDVSYSQEPNESLSVILPDIENTKSELECQLCLNLYHEPLTTLCGHSFCQSCLMKVIEKNPKCPLCRFLLWNESYCARYPVDRSLQRICMQFFPAIYNEKTFALQKQHEQETVDVPIFVCALAFPRIPCPLHIFEPRYKLMVQRCLDSDRQRFGMCVPLPQGGYASVGVLLDIRHVQVLPNSNLLVDTIGTRRFRVIKRGARDNYNIASIEYIDDEPDDGQPDAFGHTVEDYVAQGVDFINTTAIGLTAETRQRFDNFYGRMPTDPSLFSLWLLAFLPLDDADKLRYLESTNTKDRLCRLTRVIKELQQKNTPRSCVVC